MKVAVNGSLTAMRNRPRRRLSHVLAPSLAGCLAALPIAARAGAEALLKPDPAKPLEVVLSAGSAHLRFYRSLWQAMTVRTPAGTELPVTDLFFYNTVAEGVPGGYWTAPAVWDDQLSFRVVANTAEGATVGIEGRRGPLKKQIWATVYPDDPVAYVVCRLSASAVVKVESDFQQTYLPGNPEAPAYPADIFVDGVNHSHRHDTQQTAEGATFLYAFLPAKDVCLAVLCAPPVTGSRSPISPLLYLGSPKGRELRVRLLERRELAPGDFAEVRYAIYWNDGDRLDEVKALSRNLQAGLLDGRFVAGIEEGRP